MPWRLTGHLKDHKMNSWNFWSPTFRFLFSNFIIPYPVKEIKEITVTCQIWFAESNRAFTVESMLQKYWIQGKNLLSFRKNKDIVFWPVFYITCVGKVHRCINSNNHNPVVCICFGVLLSISINSSSRKTSQDSWKQVMSSKITLIIRHWPKVKRIIELSTSRNYLGNFAVNN